MYPLSLRVCQVYPPPQDQAIVDSVVVRVADGIGIYVVSQYARNEDRARHQPERYVTHRSNAGNTVRLDTQILLCSCSDSYVESSEKVVNCSVMRVGKVLLCAAIVVGQHSAVRGCCNKFSGHGGCGNVEVRGERRFCLYLALTFAPRSNATCASARLQSDAACHKGCAINLHFSAGSADIVCSFAHKS